MAGGNSSGGTYTLAELRERKRISWSAYDYCVKSTGVYDVYVLGYLLNSYVGFDDARDEATKTVRHRITANPAIGRILSIRKLILMRHHASAQKQHEIQRPVKKIVSGIAAKAIP